MIPTNTPFGYFSALIFFLYLKDNLLLILFKKMAYYDNFCQEFTHPLVIKNKINKWEILKFEKNDWCDEFQNKLLKFRQGDNKYRESPYWEQLCFNKYLNLKTFFEMAEESQDNWLYLDYQRVKDINKKLCKAIKWVDVGLPDFSGEDSTLWIGSKGAHTPCHLDTYGCNFVAQLFGRKLWILIPPEESENLNPVRVPYEESSIYSSYNFYTPNNNLLRIKHAFKIVLSPGDVLFVPRHWWHYVENLETAISVNVWIPMEIDHESRLEECLVRHYIQNICKNLNEEDAKNLLNPNELELLEENDFFSLLLKCIQNIKRVQKKEIICKDYLEKFKDEVSGFIILTDALNFETFLSEKSKYFNYSPSFVPCTSEKHINEKILLAKNLINFYCHPKYISYIKNQLLNQFNTNYIT